MRAARSRLIGPAAALLVAVAGLLGPAASPAAAAWCSGAGVNVVVDFRGLGGGVHRGCDRSGAGRTADRVFPAAGFVLDYVQRQPGFVCRVKGAPSNDPCATTPPADAYWGLFWSDGKSGKWTYATRGVGSLSVGDGGFLAFSWQDGGPQDPPGAAPVNQQPQETRSPDPTPTPKTTPKPAPAPGTKGPDKGPGTGAGTGEGTGADPAPAPDRGGPEASGDPTTGGGGASPTGGSAPTSPRAAKASRPPEPRVPGGRPSTGSSPSPSSTATATPSPDDLSDEVASLERVDGAPAPGDDPGGLPGWVPVGVVAGLGATAAGAGIWRRRRGV